ncbi:hypothetical protein M9H77_17254 [Catharanthus roseus]|uniref:Uncharacterized protein n=1 Tax=Catharanthus roseus TaxID=4058 RepID=A0ACC0B443_CATRO|nr:hypothetical protein M9H77_17254 [Catharanthus roseus]
MDNSKSSIMLILLFSLLSILFFFKSVESAHHIPHDDFRKCLESQNSNSVSQVTFTPKSSSYDSILQSLVSNFRALSSSPFMPRIILTPSHESQIQATIYFPFVMVDLRNFNSISIDKENRKARIKAGATLGKLYYNLAEESRTIAFVAGTCPSVGVGGHFSGGGFSMMSRRFGLAADYIVDAKIIDVNGQILDRKSMGEDLFWAIRGGGGAAFGIITEWTVNLLTVPKDVTVFNVTRTLEQNATDLVHRWQFVADKIDENLLIRLFINSRTIEVTFTSLFLGGIDDLLKVMNQSFPELGLRKEDCQEMNVLLNRSIRFGRPYFKGKSDYGIWKILLEGDVGRTQLQFTPYGGRLNDFSESSLPFPHRVGNIFMIHYIVDLDLGVNNIVGNTSYRQARVWGAKYFKNNFNRLVHVKTQVDPNNFFRNEQSIPPLNM